MLITDELARRTAREPDYALENRALVRVAGAMDDPDHVLQTLVETVMEVCGAESAGVSVLESGEDGSVFRCRAVAGKFAANADQLTPRDGCPSGVVIARGETMLFARPARFFPGLGSMSPDVTEDLLAPFYVDGTAAGTVWALSHSNGKSFDAEDARVLTSLSRFASSIYQLLRARDAAERGQQELERRVSERTEELSLANESLDLEARERKRVELAIRNSEERVNRALDIGTVGILFLKTNGTILWANDAFLRMSGYSREDLKPGIVRWSAMTPPEWMPVSHQALKELHRSGHAGPYEQECFRKDGSRWYALVAATLISEGESVKYITDITDKKRTEAQLLESEERFRAMVSQTTVAVAEIEPLGTLTFVNDQFAATLGYSVSELIGQDILDFTHPEEREENQQLQRTLTTEAVPFQAERRFVRKDGNVRWANASVSPICDPDGNVRSVVLLAADITERKQTEEALRESEERHRQAMDIGTVGIILFTTDGRITWANEGFLRMSGYDRQDVRDGAARWDIMTPPEWMDDSHNAVREFTEFGYTRPYEKEYIRKDGSRWWGLFAATKVSENEGVEYIIDVTESKRTEAQLAASEERFRAMVSQTNVAIALSDLEGHITFANEGMTAMLGYDEPELVGRNFQDFTHADDIEESLRLCSRLTSEAAAFQHEKRYLRKDGSICWVNNSVAPIRDTEGKVHSAVVLSVDISERVQAEQELRDSEERYRSLFESIDQGYFVADVLFDENDRPFDICYVEANPAAKRMTGSDYRGRRLSEIDPGFEDYWFEIVGNVARTGESVRMEQYAEPLDTWFDFFIFKIGEVDSRRVAVVFKDDTERKRREELLRQSERDLAVRVQEATSELRSLSRQLLQVQEAERRHLAHELHDEIGQALTGLTFSLEMARRENGSEYLKRATEINEYLVGQVRTLTLELRPPVLDDMGLMPALLALSERYKLQTGIDVEIHQEGAGRRFPGEVETAAYRIAQEALTNVARHSETDKATVRVLVEDQLMIWVKDDGVGFDIEAARVAGKSSGLAGMQERAILAGGSLTIDSVPGGGTTIFAELPLEGPGEENS